MDRAENILLVLLRNSLWGTPVGDAVAGMDRETWDRVWSLSRFHTVQGIVFDAVRSLPAGQGPELSLSARWALESRRIAENNAHIGRVTDSLGATWKRLGIDAVHLKGIRMATMYPVPEHRVCGDIDWYFRSDDDRCRANGWAAGQGLDPKLDSDGTANYVFDGVVVEHHHLPFDPEDPKEIIVMTNLHILKHSLVLGVGLRQLCDMAVVYRHFAGQYAPDGLRRILEDKGLIRWTALLHRVLVDYLGLPKEFLPWPLAEGATPSCGKDAARYVGMVLKDGNFGLQGKRNFPTFAARARLFIRYAPNQFIKRWFSLAGGRLFVKNKKAKCWFF